ncbi:DNA-directed RNA polymerase subunit beta [Microgenomates group bacterium RBG_16_45_19]|nr:MAG: DNA-directed RNA polymerase subunit beta [Microgenomates group bacterium RBG_16_45_19]
MAKTTRVYLGKANLPLPKLDLVAVQQNSYTWFLTHGIREAFNEINPVEDFTGKNWSLEFLDYAFGNTKHTPSVARNKGVTYDVPLRVKTRLTNKQTGKSVTQEVFLGDIPRMTENGTFIINGIERAVVNQIVRSPGVFYSGVIDRSSGRLLYQAELRPIRGSWLEFMISKNDVISVKIDRHRKIAATTLLRAVGLDSDEALINQFKAANTDPQHDYLAATLSKDITKTRAEALMDIYQKMRPGEPAVLDNAEEFFHELFFDPRRYDLGKVGRYKLNRRLSLNITNDQPNHVLTSEDIIGTIDYLINLQNQRGRVDDIDHLSNRRVRSVGELVNVSAFRIGLLRLERSIREKMSLTKTDEDIKPNQLVNARPVIATISEFFRRNRLSTILDQTNPLSEIDNLRRLSVMGSGGVTRERASFSMRDINASQYSRICPVRSPEGPNIGLVTYLSLYTRVNEFGFLEAPYRKVQSVVRGGKTKMQVTNDIVYFAADEEAEHYITQAEVDIDDRGFIKEPWVPVRYNGEFMEAPVEQVEYIDIATRQVFGTAASLIPFISHDEANRALMGTHMQCQAVPLVKPESPIIGTGMEAAIVAALHHAVRARHAGTIEYVDATKIVIKLTEPIKDLSVIPEAEFIQLTADRETYLLKKFMRSAQSTAYSQRPLVSIGDRVTQDQVIIDGPACDHGELALGSNLVIAYTSFDGLGYEDAIIISDRLVKEDTLTSIHINEYDAVVMDTKLGPEELTRDIPNVGETDLRNLGDDGIVVLGSVVGPNDILVGKIAPKGETELTAEERLLRAIFGEKAREVRDTSLRMPHGESGTIIDVKVLDREEGDELDPGAIKKVVVRVAQMRKVTVGDKLAGRHGNKGVISQIIPQADMPHLEDGTPVDIIISPLSVLARMNLGQLLEAHFGWAAKKLGYQVSLPVFEEIPEAHIQAELAKAGLPVDGKAQLYDGRSGEAYQEKTVVGIGYMLKLIHMVEDKTHARSTGPYSLVTQQPLGGKAQMGGQRLGEMEVWALQAHKAAHTLQEMLTIKSDDVVGRARAFEAIVEGQDIPEATVPESFKVLVKELNSLALDVVPLEQTEVVVDEPVAEADAAVAGTITDDQGVVVAETEDSPPDAPEPPAPPLETGEA